MGTWYEAVLDMRKDSKKTLRPGEKMDLKVSGEGEDLTGNKNNQPYSPVGLSDSKKDLVRESLSDLEVEWGSGDQEM